MVIEKIKKAKLIIDLFCFENRANLMFSTGQTINKINEIYDDEFLKKIFSDQVSNFGWLDKQDILNDFQTSRVLFVILGVLYEEDILLNKEFFREKLSHVVDTCTKLLSMRTADSEGLTMAFNAYDDLFIYSR